MARTITAQDLIDDDDDTEVDEPVIDESQIDDDDDDDDDTDDDESSKKFTQTELNRFLSKEKRKAKRSIEEVLGMSVDDAVSALKDMANGVKPELQAQLDQREERLGRREEDLDDREMQLTVREQLQEAGCRPERIKRAVRLVDLEDDFDNQDIADAIGELKDEFPELFTPARPVEDEGTSRRRSRTSGGSTSPRVPRKKATPKEDAFSKGAQMAASYTTHL